METKCVYCEVGAEVLYIFRCKWCLRCLQCWVYWVGPCGASDVYSVECTEWDPLGPRLQCWVYWVGPCGASSTVLSALSGTLWGLVYSVECIECGLLGPQIPTVLSVLSGALWGLRCLQCWVYWVGPCGASSTVLSVLSGAFWDLRCLQCWVYWVGPYGASDVYSVECTEWGPVGRRLVADGGRAFNMECRCECIE